MRFAACLATLLITCAIHAQVLPTFPSEQLEEVTLDTTLNDQPLAIEQGFKNYERRKSKLVVDKLSYRFTLHNGIYTRVGFYVNNEPFLIYQYDQYGRIKEQQRLNGFLPRTSYEYNEEDLTSTEINYRQNGDLHSSVILVYNDSFKPIRKTEYRCKENLQHYWTYTYDAKGTLTRESYFDEAGGQLEARSVKAFVNKYNTEHPGPGEVEVYQNQVLNERTIYNSYPDSTTSRTLLFEQDGTPAELKFQLISDSLRVSIKGFFEQGDTSRFRSRFREIYLFDDLVEYESRTLSGTRVQRYATFYEFDIHKNWIKKITYENGIAIREVTRKITY